MGRKLNDLRGRRFGLKASREMVDAGVCALYEYRDSYGDRQLVEAVYNAMERLKSQPPRQSFQERSCNPVAVQTGAEEFS